MKSNADALRERVTELETRLAAAEARIAALEMRPPAILPPVFAPAPAPIYSAPFIPYPPWVTTTCGQHHPNSNEVMSTGQHLVVS